MPGDAGSIASPPRLCGNAAGRQATSRVRGPCDLPSSRPTTVTAETEPRRAMAAGESAGVAANGKVAFDAPANGRGPASGSPVDLGTVLAGVSAGITVQDSSGRLLYANQVAARMSGFETPEELL